MPPPSPPRPDHGSVPRSPRHWLRTETSPKLKPGRRNMSPASASVGRWSAPLNPRTLRTAGDNLSGELALVAMAMDGVGPLARAGLRLQHPAHTAAGQHVLGGHGAHRIGRP